MHLVSFISNDLNGQLVEYSLNFDSVAYRCLFSSQKFLQCCLSKNFDIVLLILYRGLSKSVDSNTAGFDTEQYAILTKLLKFLETVQFVDGKNINE